MKYDPAKHHRRSIRLKGYDYASPGAYFITICVQNRECILGEITDNEMRLNTYGRTVDEFWPQVPIHFTNISVDAHITMPNHIHAIITIHERRGAVTAPDTVPVTAPNHIHESRRDAVSAPDTVPVSAPNVPASADMGIPHEGGETPPLQPGSTIARPMLGQVVGYYKYQTTKIINQMHDTSGARFWQRNYWEHIIRDENAFQHIYEYVQNNPALWEKDQLHPDALPNPFNQG